MPGAAHGTSNVPEKALVGSIIETAFRDLRAPEGARAFNSAFHFVFHTRRFEDWCEWLDLDADVFRDALIERVPQVRHAREREGVAA